MASSVVEMIHAVVLVMVAQTTLQFLNGREEQAPLSLLFEGTCPIHEGYTPWNLIAFQKAPPSTITLG